MKKVFLITVLVSFFAVSFVSAWPFSITGFDVSVNTPFPNVNRCEDLDGGTFINESGYVRVFTTSFDKCKGSKITRRITDEEGNVVLIKGYSGIKEYYCDENGKKRNEILKAGDDGLPEGICYYEPKPFGGKLKNMAVWKKVTPMCTVEEGGVRDETNDLKEPYCNGKNYVEYSCNDDGTVNTTVFECSGKCNAKEGGCIGTCTEDTDPSNDVDVPGKLTLDGELVFDTCKTNGKAVKQYACGKNGLKSISSKSCGPNKICVDDAVNGAYCASVATTPVVNKVVTDATADIVTSDELDAKIDAKIDAAGVGTGSGIGITSLSIFDAMGYAEETGQVWLGLSMRNGEKIRQTNGHEECGENSLCLFGFGGVNFPETEFFNYDNTGIIGCGQQLNLDEIESSSDWVEGSRFIVQYMCISKERLEFIDSSSNIGTDLCDGISCATGQTCVEEVCVDQTPAAA